MTPYWSTQVRAMREKVNYIVRRFECFLPKVLLRGDGGIISRKTSPVGGELMKGALWGFRSSGNVGSGSGVASLASENNR